MARWDKMVEKVTALMDEPERIRNLGIVAHIDHGKTTLSDNLLAGAGMISKELAGHQLEMDFDPMEQARGITINSANVSMVHNFNGTDYLINLIDTPGHVDFGGDVTRAMRAVDGALVVVDAVEGTMPQTETVLRQALRENVKPLLFVNKVDRLINELKVDKQEMQIRLGNAIDNVNKLIKGMDEKKYNNGWRLDAAEGTVAFGSALYNWAISVPFMKESGIDFNAVFDYCKEGNTEELAEKAQLHAIVLDMVVNHLPNPLEAQPLRVPVIWRGDKEAEIGKAMVNCNRKADPTFMITDITIDPHAGEVATGRVFSGTMKRGLEMNISGYPKKNRLQSVGLFMGSERIEVEEVPAGNIAAVTGLKDAVVGSTITTLDGMTPFEVITHVSEPVMTVAIEAVHMKDLPKLIEVLRMVGKEDPTLRIEINEETGEHLMSGMGELHLEVTAEKIKRDKHLEINTSEPIVVYRETVVGEAGPVEGKSPNRHNRFYFKVMPLEPGVVEIIRSGEFSMNLPEIERRKMLMEAGMSQNEAKKVVDVYATNLLVDMTKGVQYLRETMELIIEGYHDAVKNGSLAFELCQGVKVNLVDVKLHEDAVHRGPAQVIPAVRSAIRGGMLLAEAVLLEPFQNIQVNTPQDQMGGAIKELQGRRGQVTDINQEGDLSIIHAKIPVADMFGFSGDIRSATEGRALWNTEFAGFLKLPTNLQKEIVMSIRQRKGLKAEMPKPSDYLE